MEKLFPRIESIGDNCELGFVLRNKKFESGGLFRWAITPIDHLLAFLEDPYRSIYEQDDLSPYSPGMVIDDNTGFCFHSKMRSEASVNGKLLFIPSESELHEIYKNERMKIDHLRSKFVKRLKHYTGSIYIIKKNSGIEEEKIDALSALLSTYSKKHILVVVTNNSEFDFGKEKLVDCKNHFKAFLPKFAPYSKANDVAYEDWYLILDHLNSNERILNQIT